MTFAGHAVGPVRGALLLVDRPAGAGLGWLAHHVLAIA
jgi:hypothetical protein